MEKLRLYEFQLRYISVRYPNVKKWLTELTKRWGKNIKIEGGSEPPYRFTISILSGWGWLKNVDKFKQHVREVVSDGCEVVFSGWGLYTKTF